MEGETTATATLAYILTENLHGYQKGRFVDTNTDFYAVEWSKIDPDYDHHTYHYRNPDPSYVGVFLVDRPTNLLFFQPFEETFYMRLLRISPVDQVKIPGNTEPKETIPYVPDIIRTYIKGFVKYLIRLHAKQTYTMGIRMSNIVMVNNEPVFHLLGLETLDRQKLVSLGLSQSDITDLQQGRRMSDFRSLGLLLTEIFKGYDLPSDIKHFMELLQSESVSSKKIIPLVANHVALMTCVERLAFLQNIKRKALGPRASELRNAVSQLTGFEDWQSSITPRHGPVFPFLAAGYSDKPSCLFRFIRNFIVHLKDKRFEEQEEQEEVQIGLELLDDLFIDSYLMHIFGLPICKLQRILNDDNEDDDDNNDNDEGQKSETLLSYLLH